mmetsp:Transcript_13158/g.28404  ORF Transcript_13158/g.28404 Transcript_13158/m.28404 type:complete len:441 (+) Transcript_13158:157-1479(+)
MWFLEKGRTLKYESELEEDLVQVETRAEILHVWAIDTKAGSFDCELRIHAKWRCPEKELKAVLDSGSDHHKAEWRPDWFPKYAVTNVTHRLFDWPSRFHAFKDEETGGVWIKGVFRFAVTVKERFNLRTFPFDIQYLNIRLEIDNGGEITCATTDDEPAVFLAGVESPEFHLPPDLHCVYGVHPGPNDMEELHIVVFLKRAEPYYMWNGFFLLWLISTVSLATWSVHWRLVGSRLRLDLTLVLTATTFKQLMGNETARVAYLKIIDVYAILVVVQLFIATFLHAIIGFLMVDCDSSSGDCIFEDGLRLTTSSGYTLDSATLIVQGVMWGTMNVLFTLYVLAKRKQNREYMNKESVLSRGYHLAVLVPALESWYKRNRRDSEAMRRKHWRNIAKWKSRSRNQATVSSPPTITTTTKEVDVEKGDRAIDVSDEVKVAASSSG